MSGQKHTKEGTIRLYPGARSKDTKKVSKEPKKVHQLWGNIIKYSDFDQFWENTVNESIEKTNLTPELKNMLQDIKNIEIPDFDDEI